LHSSYQKSKSTGDNINPLAHFFYHNHPYLLKSNRLARPGIFLEERKVVLQMDNLKALLFGTPIHCMYTCALGFTTGEGVRAFFFSKLHHAENKHTMEKRKIRTASR
jgi:hypothetical protein